MTPAVADTAGAGAAAPLLLVFWGVRGSVPAPGPTTAGYGGNTPCVELRAADGRRLIFDAGTGLRAFGDAFGAAETATVDLAVLITHGHADHVHGLPFFAPLAHGRATLTVYAAAECVDIVRGAVRAVLQPPLFPVANGLADRLPIRALADGEETFVAGFGVRTVTLAHPGGATGFVVRDPATGARVAYLSDNELAAIEGAPGGRRALVESLADVDVLMHDATYLPAELGARRGWGHSSYAEAVRLASDAGVRRLVLFHHDPTRDDDGLDRLTRVAQALGAASRPAVVVEAARERAVSAVEARVGAAGSA